MAAKKTGAADTRAKRGKGKPFAKGNIPANAFTANDPRANTSGQRSAAAVAFTRNLRESIIAQGESPHKIFKANGELVGERKFVEWMVERVWLEALKGEAWAINFIADRTEGKSPQSVDLTSSDGSMTPTAYTFIPYACDDTDNS